MDSTAAATLVIISALVSEPRITIVHVATPGSFKVKVIVPPGIRFVNCKS